VGNTTPTHPNARILSTWENVKRTLETAARRTKGGGILKVAVEFNERGVPIRHTVPEVTRIEPIGSEGGDGLLEVLAE